ncbi:hypothetical protein ADL03_42345 [Nocardia sp. NRRL S-836]|nr:hypothetical protein ADL03_42345 [Nocardia sp. NRRL S-836]
MLAFVALSDGRAVSYARLYDAFGVIGDVGGQTTVRSHVSRLRKALGPEVIPLRDDVRLAIEPGNIDVHQYESLLAAARSLPRRAKLAMLRKARDLWRPGWPLSDCEALASQVERLGDSRRALYLELIDTEIRCDEPHEAVTSAERAITLWPIDEHVWSTLFRALSAAGRGREIESAFTRYLTNAKRHGIGASSEIRAAVREHQRAGTPPVAKSYSAPYQLPPFVTALRGRDAELARLDVLLGEDGSAAPVATITGAAGVGKTAVALAWATRVDRRRFVDGRLYVDLAGFSGRTPVQPETVLSHFVRSFGVEPVGWPVEDLRSAYRSILADSAVLVVLDNAENYEQVRDLVAVGPRSRTVVTSRSALHVPNACEIRLPKLPEEEGLRLLADLIGEKRVRDEPAVAKDIVARCGGLPLAIEIVGAKTSQRESHSLRSVLGELDGAGAILEIKTGDRATLREMFSWTCNALSRNAARVSHVLALHPGSSVRPEVIAYLAGLSVREVSAALDELLSAHVAHAAEDDRYAVHDVIREYALTTSEPEFAEHVRETLLKYLLWFAIRCDRVLGSGRDLPVGEPENDVPLPRPATREEAMKWLLAEHQAFTDVLKAPVFAAWSSYRWLLPAALCTFHIRSGFWRESEQLLRDALKVDRSYLGRDAARFDAVSHRLVGLTQRKLGSWEPSMWHLRQSVRIAETAGARLDVANAHQQFAVVLEDQRRWDEVLDHCAAALSIYEELGDRRGIAHVLNTMLSADLATGQLERAEERGAEALAAIGHVRDDYGKASIHRNVLRVHRKLGAWSEMAAHGEAAAALYREDSPANEARVLVSVAEARRRLGRDADAVLAADRARALFKTLPHLRDSDKAALARLEEIMSER